MEHYDLSAYLAPAGKAPGIGQESTTKLTNNIKLFASENGSSRFVAFKGRIPVSVLQVVSMGDGKGIIANVYTLPEYRRQGYTKKLKDCASYYFDTLEPAPKHQRSEAGQAWVEGMFVPNKRIKLDFEEWNRAAQKLVLEFISAIDPGYFESTFGAPGGVWTVGDVLESGVFPTKLTVAGHTVNVEISAKMPKKGTNDPRFYLLGFASTHKSGSGAMKIGIVLNAQKDIREIKSWDFVRDIEGVLRHEVTHTLDPHVAKRLPRGYSDDASEVDYVNAMVEVKAFGNELVYVIRNQLRDLTCYTLNSADCREEFRLMFEEEMKQYPYRMLNEKNRRRLFKDVYAALTEEVES